MIDRQDLHTVLAALVYGLIIMLAVTFLGMAAGMMVRAFLWASGL